MKELKFLHPLDIDVKWGELDMLGHLNNVVFIRYFESSRIHVMMQSGIWDLFAKQGLSVVLAKIDCNFLAPVHFPDKIQAQCALVSVGNSSIVVEHQLISKKTNQLVAHGQGVMVCFDFKKQTSAQIPAELKQILIDRLL